MKPILKEIDISHLMPLVEATLVMPEVLQVMEKMCERITEDIDKHYLELYSKIK